MVEKFQLTNDINSQNQESEWTSSRINRKKTAPRHIRVKPLKTKDKEQMLRISREGKNYFQENNDKNDG